MDIEKRPLGRDVKSEQRPAVLADDEPLAVPTPPPSKKKKSALTAILAILLVVALVGLGALGWLFSQQAEELRVANDEVAQQKSTVENLQRQLGELREPDGDNQATVEANNDDSKAIVDAASLYATKVMVAHPDAPTDYSFEITKQTDQFAMVSVGTSGAGYGMLLKKADNQWVVISSGHQVDQATLDQFGVPSDFIQQAQL